MKIDLVCFSKLVNEDTCDYHNSRAYDMAEGQKVEDLLQQAGIPKDDVKIAFVKMFLPDNCIEYFRSIDGPARFMSADI